MTTFECPDCGETHDLWDAQIGYGGPDAFLAVPADERAGRTSGTDDLAVVDGTAFFIRCVLDIPVVGEEQPFAWGVWAKVAEEDFHRYRAAFDARGQESASPFPGRIANQVPGYPQTVGLTVRVDPGSGATRPTLAVVDDHPLAVEQRRGITPERLLELLSPWLHQGTPIRSAHPYFATLPRDGWRLLDAEACLAAWSNLNWLPPRERRRTLAPGEIAKLLFQITASDERGDPEEHVERMWVEITERVDTADGPVYRGVLTNHPKVAGLTRSGMEVWWAPHHVVDIVGLDDQQASLGRDVLHCPHHGPSFPAYVCQHLPRGTGAGFHQADDSEAARPDAWCDACDAVLAAEGEWNDRSEAVAQVTLLCTACYDVVAERNRRVDGVT